MERKEALLYKFNTNLFDSFIEFERSCKKEIRGGTEMYDLKGHYKWLSLHELFEHWIDLKKHDNPNR